MVWNGLVGDPRTGVETVGGIQAGVAAQLAGVKETGGDLFTVGTASFPFAAFGTVSLGVLFPGCVPGSRQGGQGV